MIPKGNGCVKWVALVPILLGITAACMGATAYLIDKQEGNLYHNIQLIQTDIHVIQQDVKALLLRKGK